MGRRKAEEVFQSPAAAAGRKEIEGEGCKEAAGEIGGEGCKEVADSLEGQAKMTQVYSGEQREKKKNQNEAEEGNRGKSVVDNKDRTWCDFAKIIVKGIVDVIVVVGVVCFLLWLVGGDDEEGQNTRKKTTWGRGFVIRWRNQPIKTRLTEEAAEEPGYG